MKHWHLDQVSWRNFDQDKIDPGVIPLVKAAALVERNGDEYAEYLCHVFHDDPAFQQAARRWAVEEVQHGDALGRWATLADPDWDYMAAFGRFRQGFRIDTQVDRSRRGSRTGELIARCMVETGTSSYYSALAETSSEPVLVEICRLIAADEYRHFKLFYDHMKRYLERERLSVLDRVRIGLGRIAESEDDELAFAYHCASGAPAERYDRKIALASYMALAMANYRYPQVQRGMGMMLKAMGLPPRGRLSEVASGGAWRLIRWKQRRHAACLARQPVAQTVEPALAA